MHRTGSQPDTLRCAQCGAENYLFASFCIACGDPFDEDRQAGTQTDDARWTVEDGGRSDPFRMPFARRPSPGVDASQAQDQPSGSRPPTAFSKLAKRETIMGVLVLVAVLGYAIFDWQRTVTQTTAYREGVTAERAKDWDKAAAAYEKAGDRQDATKRAHNARHQVAERNTLYIEGVTAAENHDWKTAASDFEQVQTIQPAFADSADRLVQARTQAFKLDLDGLIYQVGDGEGAGLYILDNTGKPRLLPGSDRYSTVRAISPDGSSFVYDRPNSDETVEHAHNLGVLFNPADVGRSPMLAAVDNGKISARPIPAVNSGGTGVFARDGLWWYSGWLSEHPDKGYNQYEIYYTNYASDPLTKTAVRLSGPFSGQRVLAFDPTRSRVVIGEAQSTGTTVYVADADGSHSTRVVGAPGDVQSAAVSRDGRWLLLVTQWAGAKIERSAWLVPFGDEAKQRWELARRLDTASWDAASQPAHLEAAFAPGDGGAARVVIDKVQGVLESLTVYDADGMEASSVWTIARHSWDGGAAGASGYDLAGFSSDGSYLAARRQDGAQSLLQLWRLSSSELGPHWSHASEKAASWWSLALPPLADRPARVQFAPRNDYVLASAPNPARPGEHDTQAIYAAPVIKDGGLGESRLIATARRPASQYLPAFAMSLGGSLLAYVDTSDELRVVFYDGKLDTPLAGSVSAVWSLGSKLDLAGER